MKNINDISNYNIVGTLSNNPNCSVWIASIKNDTNPNNLFIINRFSHNKQNLNLFKEFFMYYSSKSKTKDIANFFASGKFFYVIFKYSKGECIAERFDEEKLTDKNEKRFKILYSILMKLDAISNLPLPAFISVASVDNICIDMNEDIKITYNLSSIFDIDEPSSKIVFKNISEIIKLLLKHELNNKYNKQIEIILEKCENCLFTSIPQLIVDLKKIENTCTEGDAKTELMKFYNQNKKKINKYSKIFTCIIVAVSGVYLCYNLFFASNNDMSAASSNVTLGNITYISNESIDPSIDNTISVPPESTPEKLIDLSVSPDTEILFNDYIVKYGDTFESICENNYSSKSFISTIKSFNNLYSDAQLVAGIIIRLPDETAVKTLHNI